MPEQPRTARESIAKESAAKESTANGSTAKESTANESTANESAANQSAAKEDAANQSAANQPMKWRPASPFKSEHYTWSLTGIWENIAKNEFYKTKKRAAKIDKISKWETRIL
jgi:hypothetical protein